MDAKVAEVVRYAQELYSRNPDWVTFFREILGVGGVVRQRFITPEEMTQFEQTEAYNAIQKMVANLRERGDDASNPQEPTRVITVRMPKSLHESLRTEAHDRRVSMNKLCISKLLQMIDQELVPQDGTVPRAVRPSNVNGSPTTMESPEEVYDTAS